MIIIRSDGNNDIDVYFPEYNWIAKNKWYKAFVSGEIKCPYEPRTCGKGYIGEGKYKTKENSRSTKYYKTWQHMLERCYDEKLQERHPTYKGCEVEEYWLNFQNFAEWLDEHYYEVYGERMELDKDIKVHGNKLYSRDTCLIVPQRINTLFTNNKNHRGDEPIGIKPNGNGYQVRCNDGYGKRINLGTYPTSMIAFNVYKPFKEKVIKKVADEYYNKGLIPLEVYEALYNYEVHIDD